MNNNHAIEDNKFVASRYLKYIKEMIKELGIILCEVSFDIAASSSESLLDDYMISVLKTQKKDGKIHMPIIDRKSLFLLDDQIDKNGKKKNRITLPDTDKVIGFNSLAVVNSKVPNESIEKYYLNKTKNKNIEEKKAICKRMLLEYGDTAAHIKLMSQAKSAFSNKDYESSLRSKYKNFDTGFFSKILNIRNEYLGHENEYTRMKLSKDKFFKELADCKKAANIFSSTSNKEIKEKIEVYTEKVKRIKEECNREPLSLSQMETEFARFEFCEDYLKGLLLEIDYDSQNKLLYFHSLDEVRKIAEEKYQLKNADKALADIKEEKANLSLRYDSCINKIEDIARQLGEIAIGEKGGQFVSVKGDNYAVEPVKDPAKEIAKNPEYIETITEKTKAELSIRDYFPHLSEYKGGYLTDGQLTEIAKNTTVIATADTWMNNNNRKYYAYDLQNYLRSAERKMVVDWNTRVELFAIEKNELSEYGESRVRDAKAAHHAIHFMEKRDFLSYLPRNNNTFSSNESIINIAKKNPEVVFAVFCNKEFVKHAVNTELKNIIPLMLLPTGKCRIWSGYMDILKLLLGNEADTGAAKEKSVYTTEEIKDSDISNNSSNSAEIVTDNSASKNEAPSVEKKELVISKGSISVKKTNLNIDNEGFVIADKIPQNGDKVINSNGNEIILGNEIGAGGEGKVYMTNSNGLAAKIFYRDKLTEFRYEKIKTMISKNITIPELCWPQSLLTNEEGQFVGYLMPVASEYVEFGQSIMKINSPAIRERMVQWDRLSMTKLCIAICKMFDKLQKKNVLMGDINPRNFLLNINNKNCVDFRVVDCDSFQIDDYPCLVEVQTYTSPKYNARRKSKQPGSELRMPEDENYALASLLFQMIMLNVLPFAGKNAEEIDKAQAEYNFAFRLKDDKENTGANTPDGSARLIWNNLHSDVKESFGKVFKYGKNVTPGEWVRVFDRYRRGLENSVYTLEIVPKNYWDNKDNEFTRYFNCANCGEFRNTPKRRFDREEQLGLPHLCAACTQIKFRIEKETIARNCDKCNKEFKVTKWDEWLASKGYRSAKTTCPDCKKDVVVICARCGRQTTRKQYFIDFMRGQGKMVWCQDCQEEVRRRKR